uniref:RAB20, member RAS onco family n=1 Tax=Leptobrachium leishanense TaxID=445787 RepID=A0A8C5M994_9ANUR
MKKPDLKVVLLGDMNVGKTSLLHRYMERRFQETVSTVGGAFYLKQWGPYNISIWDTAGRERFHGLGSMYCRAASAVILTYDVSSMQSLLELEDRFLTLTDTVSDDCVYAVVGNKVDLTDVAGDEDSATALGTPTKIRRQVQLEDALAFYKKIIKTKMLDETSVPPAEKLCFETSAKTGYNVDTLFEGVFSMVVPLIKKQDGQEDTVNLEQSNSHKETKKGCC